jgi:hypothetical protein
VLQNARSRHLLEARRSRDQLLRKIAVTNSCAAARAAARIAHTTGACFFECSSSGHRRASGASLAGAPYELLERAVALGWPPQQVVLIDADLGRSGTESSGWTEFKELVAVVEAVIET